MTNVSYKVVGIQIAPKNKSNNKNIINQVAWNGLKNCRSLFEKLILPPNNATRIDKNQKGKKFSVVGIINVQQGMNESLIDMRISRDESGLDWTERRLMSKSSP